MPNTGVLISGSLGTGRRLLARVIAQMLHQPLRPISCRELTAQLALASADHITRCVDEMYNLALATNKSTSTDTKTTTTTTQEGRAVVLLHDIDAVCQSHSQAANVLAGFMHKIQLHNITHPQQAILIVATAQNKVPFLSCS